MYVQENETEDIKSFLIFKRQLKMIVPINNEEDPESLTKKLEKLEGKMCTLEFDEPEEENRSIIPKRLKLFSCNSE